MSHEIEYDRTCFVLPQGSTDFTDMHGLTKHPRSWNEYFLFIQQGCNNIHPRPRKWYLESYGANWTIIQRVCERAGSTEGGMLKPSNRDTTPENYLRRYRKVIAEAEVLTNEALSQRLGIQVLSFHSIKPDLIQSLDTYYTGKWHRTLDFFTKEDRPNYGQRSISLRRPYKSLEDLFIWIEAWSPIQLLGGYPTLDCTTNK
jgi:hypothetical protein